MPELIDTHCHIQSVGGSGERGTRKLWAKAPELKPRQIIANAKANDVTKLICVGCDVPDSQLAVNFVQGHDNCWASIGIHPHEAKDYAGKTSKLAGLAELVQKPKVIAVGECGLDYYYKHSPPAAQEEVLRYQINLAKQYDLPLIFHVREAFDSFWPIFDDHEDVKGVLHSFTDNSLNLRKAIDRGLYIGVNGIATFTKDPAQLEVYEAIPLERLVLETDSPFLAPVPHRGSVNLPQHVSVIAEFLASIRGEDRTVLANTTTANARQLFGTL